MASNENEAEVTTASTAHNHMTRDNRPDTCRACSEQRHRDAIADTGAAYQAFHGWSLRCLWCNYEVVGRTKADALRGIQEHYDDLLPEGCAIR